MPRTRLFVVLLVMAALNEGGCAQLNLPQRGFATRYFVQSIEPRFRNDGQQEGVGESRGAMPSVDKNIPEASATNPDQMAGAYDAKGNAATLQKCIDVARNRGRDAGYQGFDDDTQKSVFDRTLADCLKWYSR